MKRQSTNHFAVVWLCKREWCVNRVSSHFNFPCFGLLWNHRKHAKSLTDDRLRQANSIGHVADLLMGVHQRAVGARDRLSIVILRKRLELTINYLNLSNLQSLKLKVWFLYNRPASFKRAGEPLSRQVRADRRGTCPTI